MRNVLIVTQENPFSVLDNVRKSNERNEMYSHTVLHGGHLVFSFVFSSCDQQSPQVSWQQEQDLRQSHQQFVHRLSEEILHLVKHA